MHISDTKIALRNSL
ncbi:hypothetical protein LXA26_17930 [Erwinia amylovora]|nr:hypothetical protein [Erwinia amylovora]